VLSVIRGADSLVNLIGLGRSQTATPIDSPTDSPNESDR